MYESNGSVLDPSADADKTLHYSCATTYAEYVASAPHPEFLAMRAREIRLLADEQAYFSTYPDPVHWLVVAADDGPDTPIVLPVLAHVAAQVPRLTLRVVREEDAPPLLATLVNDPALLASWAEADLPLLLSFDDEWHFQEGWGPHPQAVEPFLEGWLVAHPNFEGLAEDDSPAGQQLYARAMERLLQEMRLWYNSGLNGACGEELRALLARSHAGWHDEGPEEAPEENR